MLTKVAYIVLSLHQSRFGRAAAATLTALALLLVNTGRAQAQRIWVEEGPGPITGGQVEHIDGGEVAGAVQTLAAHPIEAGTIYIGAVNGGIWKTTNANDASPHWEAQVVADGRSLSIGAIAFDPTDQNWKTLMAGSGLFSNYNSQGGAKVGVWLTTNGGDTWKLRELAGRNISGVAPRGATLVISADELSSLGKGGIWRSDDGGESWTQLSVADPRKGELPAGSSFDLASDPMNNDRLYTNAGTHGIYRSDNKGATWEKISNCEVDTVLRAGAGATNVKIAVGTSNNVYVAIVDSSSELSGLFRFDNNYGTWVSLDLPITVEHEEQFGIHTENQGHTNMSIVADRTDANVVYIGGDQQPRFSPANSIGATDSTGRLFRVVLNPDGHSEATPITHAGTSNNSAPHADSRDMEFDANSKLLETDDGGIYRRPTPRTNEGDWVSLNGNLRITEFRSVAWDSHARIAIGGAWDTGTPEQSQTGSQIWHSVSHGDGSEVAVYDRPDFSERYSSFANVPNAGAAPGGFRRRTCDEQNRCSEEYPSLNVSPDGGHIRTSKGTRIAVNRVDPRRIVIGADSVYESNTYGSTIVNIGPGIEASNFGGNAIAYGADDNPDVLYVLGKREVYIRNGPPPATLDQSTSYLGRDIVKSVVINPADSQTAYVLDVSHVYRTTNAGVSWDKITGDLTTAHTTGDLHALAYRNSTGNPTGGSLIVGSDNGVFVAEGPNFDTWRRLGVGLPRAPVYDLDYDDADGMLVAALFGRGAWRVNLNEPERGPADVMLVLDLSGSMRSPACPGCRPKLEVLQDSVEIFIRLFTAFALPTDRLGVVYFRTGVSEFPAGSGVLVPALSSADNIIVNVRAQTASGGTAMGGGLQQAVGRLTETARPRHIVLFTDGMQNVNPMVNAATLVIANEAGRGNSGINPTSPPTVLDATRDIKVSTIGVGATPAFVDLLDHIAGETGGIYHLTMSPDEDLRKFYVEDLIAVFRQFSPQLIGYRHGVASRDTSLEAFTVNASARRVVLNLSWQRGDSMAFSVLKDGVDVTRLGRVISGPFYSIFAIDLPAAAPTQLNPAGDWQMVIRGPEGAKYEAAAIVEEEQLKYDFAVGGRERVVGDPLPLNVRLSFAGRPVTDANVSARVLAPQQSLGTLLSKSPSPAVPVKFLYESSATDAQRKFQLLLAQDSFRAALQPTEFPINFRNNGDGTYSATFNGTAISGAYTIIFRAEGQRPDIGKYDRTESRSVTLRFGAPSLAASELSRSSAEGASQPTAGGNYELRLRPVDGLGNYLGPDYGHAINVSVNGIRVTQAPRDLLDGSYNFSLMTTRPPALTNVVVTVLGRSLYNGTLAGIPGEEAAPSRFAFSAHTGVAFPAKGFGRAARAGLLTEFDFEYRVTPSFSLEGVLGRYDFGTPGSLKSGSLFFKGYTPVGTWRAYGSAGPGVFWSQGNNARFGLSAGAGLNRPLNTRLEVDFGAGYSQVFRPGRDLGVVGLKAGVKFTF